MSENLLVPLPGFTLPQDFPWRVKFISAVDEQLRRLRATGHYVPARFFGYYLRGASPMGVSGSWTVSLEAGVPWRQLITSLDRITCGQFNIVGEAHGDDPDFMLVHDRLDGACWLWRFAFGMKFVEATDPVTGEDRSSQSGEERGDRRLLGP